MPYLLENTRSDNRYDSDVSDRILDLMFNVPQPDRYETYYAHPVLLESERLPRWPNRPYLDLSVSVWRTSGLVARKQEQPDEYDGDNGYRQSDGKPAHPIKLGTHKPNGVKVLRGRDRRALTTDVGSDGNSELRMSCISQSESSVSGVNLQSNTA